MATVVRNYKEIFNHTDNKQRRFSMTQIGVFIQTAYLKKSTEN